MVGLQSHATAVRLLHPSVLCHDNNNPLPGAALNLAAVNAVTIAWLQACSHTALHPCGCNPICTPPDISISTNQCMQHQHQALNSRRCAWSYKLGHTQTLPRLLPCVMSPNGGACLQQLHPLTAATRQHAGTACCHHCCSKPDGQRGSSLLVVLIAAALVAASTNKHQHAEHTVHFVSHAK